LLLQRLSQLIEQPRVLDGDDGLIREIANQLDMPVRERTNLLAIDDDNADQHAVLEHRHGKPRAVATKFKTSDYKRIPREISQAGPIVVDVRGLFRERGAVQS